MRLKLDQKEAMEDEHLEIVSSDLEKAVHRAVRYCCPLIAIYPNTILIQ